VQDATKRADVSGNGTKREIWAADSETDPFKRGRIPRPFIWGAYNGSEYHEFATAAEFVAFIRDRDCIVYAHNGGRFDWHYLIDQLAPFSTVMVIAGRLAKFKIGKAEFRDSYNIMPMPLRDGGKKLEIEDFSILEADVRDLPANKQVIRDRCRTDCIYLHEMLMKFIAEFGLHLTISSASMNAWHKISGIEKPNTTAQFYSDIAPYYFGGRVECFEPGIVERPFKIYDINSAYLAAMEHLHPWGESIDEYKTLPDGRSARERAFITLEADATGAFPFRERDGSLGFPADRQARIFHVTGWEYLSALETGTLGKHAVQSVLRLPATIHFREYNAHFYGMKTTAKANGDKAYYEFAKRFLCSLYGKFGSNPDEYQEYQVVEPRFIEAACEADGYNFCAEFGPWALLSRPLLEDRQRYYNVAVAASITGYVRATCWRALRQSVQPLYIDTDCIHVVDPGALDIDETRLGAWKLEAECNFGAYAGKKLYACKVTDEWRDAHPRDKAWKIASKGVRLTHEEICAIARGEDFEYDPEVPQYSMKRGIQFVKRKIKRTTRAA
jgi:hypothetical protein